MSPALITRLVGGESMCLCVHDTHPLYVSYIGFVCMFNKALCVSMPVCFNSIIDVTIYIPAQMPFPSGRKNTLKFWIYQCRSHPLQKRNLSYTPLSYHLELNLTKQTKIKKIKKKKRL